MDTLQDYLQNEYRDHKRELDHLDRLLAEVWPIFPGTLVAEGWPYEVRNGHKPVPLTDNYSYSTNAMILFAMAVALGWAEPSALVPRIQPADLKKGEKKEFRERFE